MPHPQSLSMPIAAGTGPDTGHVTGPTPRAARSWVLRHADTFALFNQAGEIPQIAQAPCGLFHGGTRFLSGLTLEIEGHTPLLLRAAFSDADDSLAFTYTNPMMRRDGSAPIAPCTLFLAVRRFVWEGTCFQELRATNYGLIDLHTTLTFRFAADYADLFEIGGPARPNRGRDLPPDLAHDRVIFGYLGLDGILRHTALEFLPAADELSASACRVDLHLRSRQETLLTLIVRCASQGTPARHLSLREARSAAGAAVEGSRAWTCHVATEDAAFKRWLDRGGADLHLLTFDLPTGPYPAAGLPWYNTPFGRDGLITALECLWLRPGLARGVLTYLAQAQATAVVPAEDAEPGKILHEVRPGEMAALREVPFGRYFGSVDATPLFVLLAGAYFTRTGDRPVVEALWPHIDAALRWIDEYGDRDGDGFVEYAPQTRAGLRHQGWRDSDDAIFHADGTLAEGPIALCEVQGYVYAARQAAAALATVLGDAERAAALRSQADALREIFEAQFWCPDLATYALALDGDKRPCRVRASTAGQCLFTGIAHPDRAQQVAAGLFKPDCFSGWGIRTIAASAVRYNPMGYHVGAVWPHDNALIALGLSRYGWNDLAADLLVALFGASLHFDLNRLPELFCGFERHAEEGPIAYPLACSPQAWSAASAFCLVQAALGLSVNGVEDSLIFVKPSWPSFLGQMSVHNLEVGSATVDLALIPHREGVNIEVLRGSHRVKVVIIK